jgi:Fe-S cluster assembly protein SufD
MNYQSFISKIFPQDFINLSGLVEHKISSVDNLVFLKVTESTQLKLWLHDLGQQVHEKKSIIYHILVEKNAKLNILIAVLDAQNLAIEMHLYLQGDGAQAELSGVYGLDGQQQLSIKTYQMHYGLNTKSSATLKGMLKGQAQANVQGLIFIDKNACKSDASQENKNIVMSKQARVVSIPSIEVLQHDVACCHGTAVGQFDDKHRWYLTSRGLNFAQVHQMLISSFFGEIVQNFENESECMEMLCKKMI